jgi:molybdopterin synthase catalytic subunit
MITALVSASPISASAYGALVASDAFGAVVTFSGNVRNIDQDKEVISLTYEIHPSAQEVLLAIVTEVADKYDLGNVAVVHRYGAIEIGESAFVVAVSAVHRGPAFLACSELVDQVKARLPIWKYQVFADGSDQWVNGA